jgi:hypothetical protein
MTGQGASGSCSAVDKDGYEYSLDGLLAQNWKVSVDRGIVILEELIFFERSHRHNLC